MKNIQITDYDSAEFIKTPEDVFCVLKVAIEDGDYEEFLDALGDVVRSEGYAKIVTANRKRAPQKLKTAAAKKSSTIKRVRKLAA